MLHKEYSIGIYKNLHLYYATITIVKNRKRLVSKDTIQLQII